MSEAPFGLKKLKSVSVCEMAQREKIKKARTNK
jgi:hypothetical protein